MRPYKLHTIDNVLVVEVTAPGLMEGPELDQMAEHLSEELMRSNDKRMVVDCHRLKFMASAALRVMVSLSHTARQFKGDLVLCAPNSQVIAVLRIAGLDRHLPVCDTREQAIAAFGDPPGGPCT